MGYYDILCAVCGHPNDVNHDYCHNKDCLTTFADPFIVRRAGLAIERDMLEKKYTAVKADLLSAGKQAEGEKFELAVLQDGKVVINTTVDFLFEWFLRSKLPYYTYRKQVSLGLRERAEYANDVKRLYVESAFFGSHELIYGALTLNEMGLSSYGPVQMILYGNLVERRAAILRENSYPFHQAITKAGWTIDDPIPPGNFCTWPDRNKLALTKCGERLKTCPGPGSYPELVLCAGKTRKEDEFMEVYIEGDIFPAMIEKVKFPADIIKRFQGPDMKEYKLQLEEIERKVTVDTYEK